MIRQQDQSIDTISGTLHVLAEQAGLMGQEIGEHNECVYTVIDNLLLNVNTISVYFRMLDDLERGVDPHSTVITWLVSHRSTKELGFKRDQLRFIYLVARELLGRFIDVGYNREYRK